MTTETRKVFLMGFNSISLDRDKLTSFLDNDPLFLNWITLLPGQVFVVAEATSADVGAKFRERFPRQFMFVTEISPLSSDGWLPKDIWSFIRNPVSAKPLTVSEMVPKVIS